MWDSLQMFDGYLCVLGDHCFRRGPNKLGAQMLVIGVMPLTQATSETTTESG